MNAVSTVIPNEVDATPLIPCLPLESMSQLIASSSISRYRRLLLPFDAQSLTRLRLDDLLEMIRKTDGELILLHVGHEERSDEEGLFSTLRGVQAHVRQIMSSAIVDSLVDNTAVSLLDYAHKNHVDLIVLPEQQA